MAEFRDPTPIDPNKDYQITELADFIRTKMDGHDVREALALGLERAYEDAATSGNANMEVAQARGSYPTLARRLLESDETDRQNTEKINSNYNEVTSQLAQTERELDSKKLDRNRGAVTSADLSQEVKEQLTGGSVAVVGKNTVLEDNIVDGQVTEEKTTFIKISTNLFNRASVVVGHSVGNESGDLIPNPTYNTSDLIEAEPDSDYSTRGFNQVVYYNEMNERVGFSNLGYSGSVFTTNSSTRFIRLQYAVSNQTTPRQINLGNELLPYEPHYKSLDNTIDVNALSLENKSITSEKLADGSVTEDIVSFIKKSSNLFNKNTAQNGIILNSGIYDETNTQHTTSDFIPVEPDSEYSFTSISYISHYDSNHNFLKRSTHSTTVVNSIETDSATYYLRVSVNTNLGNVETVQINKGAEILPYEEFGYYFNDNIKGISGSNVDLWTKNPYVIEGIADGFYHGEELPAVETPYSLPKETLYSWYDDLVGDSVHHKKETLGTDGVDNPIYAYHFNAPRVGTVGNGRLDEKIPKMILISGVHGQEKAGVYNLYNTVKAIIQDWKTDERLETLRFNTDFIIVPIVNPDGFDRTERKNENGVDLARNFPERWENASDNPESVTYKGSSPLSESGSRAVYDLLQEHNENAILFMSHHNFGGTGGFVWNAASTKMQLDLSKKLISKLTREWQKENEWLPQDDDWFAGYADDGSPNGSESMYAASLGIQSSTFEIAHTFPYESEPEPYNSSTFTFGIEVLVNWLVMNLRENTKFYNKLQ